MSRGVSVLARPQRQGNCFPLLAIAQSPACSCCGTSLESNRLRGRATTARKSRKSTAGGTLAGESGCARGRASRFEKAPPIASCDRWGTRKIQGEDLGHPRGESGESSASA
jgi:hypothetical protein